MRKPARRDLHQARRNVFGGFVREAGEDDLVEHRGLLFDRRHDLWVPMPVRDDPPR